MSRARTFSDRRKCLIARYTHAYEHAPSFLKPMVLKVTFLKNWKKIGKCTSFYKKQNSLKLVLWVSLKVLREAAFESQQFLCARH